MQLLFKFTLSVKIFGFFNCSRNLTNQWVLLIITLFSAYILNAEIPLFSLKIKSLISKITHYKLAFCFFFSVVVFFQYAGIPLVIICYVVLSIVSNKFYWMEKSVKRKQPVSRRLKKTLFFRQSVTLYHTYFFLVLFWGRVSL
jgi:hypothetical protein